MQPRPTIIAEVVMLAPEDGGRQTLVDEGYVPHVVVQDRAVRHATVDDRGQGNEKYLGVRLILCDGLSAAGVSSELKFELMYWPQVDYSKVVPGASFTIREGARIVGHGVVLSRENPVPVP